MDQHNNTGLSPLSDIRNATSFVVQRSWFLVVPHIRREVPVHSTEDCC